jgi:hypothetical protein
MHEHVMLVSDVALLREDIPRPHRESGDLSDDVPGPRPGDLREEL